MDRKFAGFKGVIEELEEFMFIFGLEDEGIAGTGQMFGKDGIEFIVIVGQFKSMLNDQNENIAQSKNLDISIIPFFKMIL